MAASGAPALRLLLGDGHRAFVEALALRLAVETDLTVVGTAGRPEEVLRIAESEPVDVAVLAVGTAEDFTGTGSRLRGLLPDVHLVAVAETDDVAVVVRALRAGFRGWVPKELGVAALLDGVRGVCRGETRIPPLLLSRLLPHLLEPRSAPPAVTAPFAALTARELEVLRAMASGATRQEIAEELEISAHTVRTHVQNVLTKLGVHTSLAAVALARRSGLG